MKLSILDKMKVCYDKGEPMPLKGHTKLTLSNDLTGKVEEVVESNNMVTNAIASILAHNWSALNTYSTMFPLWQLFGGVLCFANNITEDADNYNIPSNLTNSMTACAGQTAHYTADTYRGNPNGYETVFSDTNVKFVWDWSTSQGNGQISCVCLCPQTLGDNGLKPFSTMGNCWTPLNAQNTVFTGGNPHTYPSSRSQFLHYPISVSDDGQTGKVIYWSGTTFEEITIKKDFFKFGIMRGVNDFLEVSSRTATTRSFTKGNIFEDSSYYYCYAITGAHAIQIDKISKADMTVTTADLSDLGGDALYTGSTAWEALNRCIPRFAYDGRYLYLPNSSGNGFVGINPNNSADIQEISGTVSLGLSSYSSGGGTSYGRPIVLNQGLVYGDTYLINGANVYPKNIITIPYTNDTTPRTNFQNTIRKGASVWDYPAVSSGYYNRGQGAILLGAFLSTINNLESSVSKSTSQVMKIEYTISEV